jgi:hypothetical protein
MRIFRWLFAIDLSPIMLESVKSLQGEQRDFAARGRVVLIGQQAANFSA